MFSRTVISRNRLWFCGTCTTPRSSICRGFFPTSGTPRNVMLPRRGLSRPLIAASSVDLPEPFGPTMQVSPPSVTLSDTPCSTSPPPYPATTPSTTSTASPPGRSGYPGPRASDDPPRGRSAHPGARASDDPPRGRSGARTAVLQVIVLVAGAEVRVEHLGVVAYKLGRSGRDHHSVVQDHDRVA